MNVFLTNDSFPPLIDGVANAVVNYAGIIQEKYGTATVFAPNYPNVSDDYPFDVIRYPSIDTTKIVGYRTGVPFANKIFAADRKADIIHSHCPAVSTIVARMIREKENVPIVMTYHTKFDIDIAKATKAKAIQEMATKIFISNISACDEVWTVSEGAGENLQKLGYEGDYVIMKNGVDFPKQRVTDDKVNDLRRELQIANGVRVFLFVGRMMWYKGCRLTLDSLCKVKASGIDFKMIFVGDGVDKDEIVAYAEECGLSDKCIFTGAVHDRTLLRTYFCLADLFLFPSTFDTNGIVIREAAACELPSLIIKGSCAAEDIEDGVDGILCSEDSYSMSRAVINACNTEGMLKQIGKNAADRIYMSWDESVKTAVERYKIVIDNYRRNGNTAKRAELSDEFIALTAKNYEIMQDFKKDMRKIEKTIKDFMDNRENTDRYL